MKEEKSTLLQPSPFNGSRPSLALDDTEQLRAGMASRSSEEEYRLLFDRNPHPMWVFDVETLRFLAVNDAALAHYGYTQEEFMGLTVMDILPEEDVPGLMEATTKPAQSKDHSDLWRHRRKDGSLIDVEIATHAVRFGGCAAQLVLAHDVTEQRRAVQALRESEERYHNLAAISPVGIFQMDSSGRCIYVNERCSEITGLKTGELLGSGWERALHPDQRESVLKSWAESVRAGKPSEMECLFLRPDNRQVVAYGHSTPIRDAAGNVTGYVGTVIDVTSRKAAENALRELTARLLVVQDEERRRLARELHDTTSQNLAALAMDLAALRRKQWPSDQSTETLFEDCTRLVEDTAREIRTLSHILHPPLLEVAGLAGALRELARGFSDRSGIQIRTELPAEFGRLARDHEAALLRVAQEGLANIHRHSGSRTGRLRLRRDAGTVIVEIEDDGAGIPPERLAMLQRDDTVVGVGIAGMRERLRQLGGELLLSSGKGGTRVRAVLPSSTL